MNTNQTKLQQIELEIAEVKARIAKNDAIAKAELDAMRSAIPDAIAIAKPKIARKPRVKPAKADQKFKNRIIAYQKWSSEREASWWIETDRGIHSFYEKFNNWDISEKLAILELAFTRNPEMIQEYLDYVPSE